jgi:hypothetical protein
MADSLLDTLPIQTVGELARDHGIDSGLFHPSTIYVGLSEDYEKGLNDWAHGKVEDTRIGQFQARSNIWKMVSNSENAALEGWSLYSVKVNQKGYATSGNSFLGHRIHPSKRIEGGLRFDTRGWDLVNRGVMLPPLSLKGAIELLSDYGFMPDPKGYEPWHSWDFILKNPAIPIWVEESALKALAACSIGQLAVGLNGINGWAQKARTDRLHPFLNRIAANGRKIIVRFDRPGSIRSRSLTQATLLDNRLRKAGAKGGGWWCWLDGMPAKTDDYIAAMIKGDLTAQNRLFLETFVNGSESRGCYSRITHDWNGSLIEREFSPEDVFKVCREHRIIVLKGATGTSKSKALVGALELVETHLVQKLVVLGVYHRASLVHKGANEYGVVNMSAPPGTPERQGLHEGRTMRSGLFACGESAYKETSEMTIWKWYWELKENPRPTLLVLDEISQVLANWTMGGTDALRKIRGKALQALEGLLQLPCVRVWAADALIGDIELEWLEKITDTTPYLLRSSFKRPRDLYLEQPSLDSERLLLLCLNDVIRSGGRFWLGHGTVAGLHRLMDALPPAEDGQELRITGEDDRKEDPRVSRLMADTEAEGPLYKRIAFSPAISCGISMAEVPVELTAIVQAYCWQAEDVLQALNRARNSYTRILLAPKVVQEAVGITKECSPERASKAFKKLMQSGDVEAYSALLQERHSATRHAVACLEARRNLECFCNEWCLRGLLEDEGYQIRSLADLKMASTLGGAEMVTQDKNQSRSLEGLKRYRVTALQRLAAGNSTLEEEQQAARRLVEGGTFFDLAEVDVSEAWTVARELGLDGLIRAGTVHSSSPQTKLVWSALTALNKDGVKRVTRALGGRADRMPGPMDPLEVRKIWALVKVLGFSPIKVGETRAEGKRWRLEALDLN